MIVFSILCALLCQPRKRWRDDLDAHHEGWFEVAQEKRKWKELGEAFAEQWDSTGLSISNGDQTDGDQLDHTLYGNIGSLKDLFLKEPEYSEPVPLTSKPSTTPEPDDDDGLHMEFPDTFKLNRTNLSNHTFDVLDFLVINEKYPTIIEEYRDNIRNISPNRTRRQLFAKVYPYDPDDYRLDENVEDLKRNSLMMVMVQFVMHCRYEVGKALLQRDLVRKDKRYKLGYLFNRLRRLKTEILKMVGAGWDQIWNKYRHMYSILRLYERVVHFDVDSRDTANLIRNIYAVDAPYDKIELKKKSMSKSDAQKIAP